MDKDKITLKRLLAYPIVVASLFFSALTYSGAVVFAEVGQCCNTTTECRQPKQGTHYCCQPGSSEAACSPSKPNYCREC